MGRRKAEPELVDPHPPPRRPGGMSEEAAEWWEAVVARKPGAVGPTEAVLLKMGADTLKLMARYQERLDAESEVRREHPDLPASVEEQVIKNYTACMGNFLRVVGEMGLTPRSRKQVAAAQTDRKKAAAPKTSLDTLKPQTFPAGTKPNGKGRHVDR